MNHSVYRMYDIEGRLLYVGCSSDFVRRLNDHNSRKSWFSDIASIAVAHHSTRAEALVAEAAAIAAESPIHNVYHKPRYVQRSDRPTGRPRGHVMDPDAYSAAARAAGFTTQRSVCCASDIAQSTLSDLRRGNARLSAKLAERLAGSLGVAPSVLFPTAPKVAA